MRSSPSRSSQEQLGAQKRLVARAQGLRAPRPRCSTTAATRRTSTVLQAEQSLFPAELTLAPVRASVFASTVNIYKAMGGGWVLQAEQRTR